MRMSAVEEQRGARADAGNDAREPSSKQTGSSRTSMQQQQQQQQHQMTSNTQRLGSIEILNENKQRQLQLKQQESFKQHLEQRQRYIQQQQQQQQDSQQPQHHVAVNPFYESAGQVANSGTKSVKFSSFADEPKPKGGVLSALMDAGDHQEQRAAPKWPPPPPSKQTDGATELEVSNDELTSNGRVASRYEKLATTTAGATSYNYAANSPHDKKPPFYKRDLATILIELRASRQLVILIVAIALLLDNMLLTAVVPIIPAYLYKLRIERQHRDQLLAGSASKLNGSTSAAGVAGSALDVNKNGMIEEEELQRELERRVNESLAKARDRYAGVLTPQLANRQRPRADDDDDQDDDDDDDDDNDGDQRTRTAERRATDKKTSPASGSSKARGGRRDRRWLADDESEREKQKPDQDDGQPVAGDYESLSDDGDENEDDSRRSRREQTKNRKSARDRERGKNEKTPTDQTEGDQLKANDQDDRRDEVGSRRKNSNQTSDGDDDDDDDQDEDDENGRDGDDQRSSEADEMMPRDRTGDTEQPEDDEELEAARLWRRLKWLLDSTTKSSANNSEALGQMCLNNVYNLDALSKDQPEGRQRNSQLDDDRRRGRKMKSDKKTKKNKKKKTKKVEMEDDDGDRWGSKFSQNPNTQNSDRPKEKNSKLAKVERVNPKPAATTTTELPPPPPPTTEANDDELVINHQDIVDESFEVGVMFASKPIVQAIVNPFVGSITNRVGFTLPMFLGFSIMFLSTLVFAFGTSYATLFLARAIQGVGSACTSVAGMSMIADRFPDDAERGNAMAIALGGLALGVVIGPPFGGFMYEFFGKPSPFIVLAILALLDGLLQLTVLQPHVTKPHEEGASLMTLIKDPYILVAAGAITFANTGIGILEPALPLWMMDTMQAKNWEQGVAFLPAALSYLFSTNLFGNLGLKIGRWRSAMLGLIIIGFSLLIIPFATRVDHLILPNGAIGFAIGMVDSTMMPMLGYLVDIRHTSVYGSVYAIGDVAFCASFVFGPALSGTLVELIGFEGLIITTALICFSFAPLLLWLRNPPARQVDEAQLQEQSSLRYVNYNHVESQDEMEAAHLTADNRSKSYVK